jgi:hypothetical protein
VYAYCNYFLSRRALSAVVGQLEVIGSGHVSVLNDTQQDANNKYSISVL